MYFQQAEFEIEPEDQAHLVAAEQRLQKGLIIAGGIAVLLLVVAFL